MEELPVVSRFGGRARDAHVSIQDPHAVLLPSEALDELHLVHLHGRTADMDLDLMKGRLADIQRGLPAQVCGRDGRPWAAHRFCSGSAADCLGCEIAFLRVMSLLLT